MRQPQPQQPAPYAPQPGPGPVGYPRATPDGGATAWWLGLLVFVPVLGILAAGIGMAASGQGQRRRGGIAAENGRHAANWGLTFLILSVVAIALHFVLLFTLAGDKPVHGFFPLGIPITVAGVLSLVHVILSIWGGVVASGGKVFRGPGIPFFRA